MLGVELSVAMSNKVTNLAGDSSLAGFLQPGDRIVAVNGNPVRDGASIIYELENLPEEEPIVFMVEGSEGTREVKVSQGGKEQVYGEFGLETIRKEIGPLAAIAGGCKQIKTIMVMTYQGIRMVIRGQIPAGEAVTGPVGIANMLGQSAQQGLYPLFFLIALISLNLGLINLIPFPALDGSRIGYAAYEFVRGKPIPPEKEGLINSIGFMILIALMIFITYKDILGFFT